MFFTGSVLNLEPREEPEEGFDARQLGNIYHHIFESLYKAVDDPADLEQLLTILPSIAGKILDEAPKKEQFRETAWWMYNRKEIIENVRNSLEALCALPGDYRPYAFEMPFGLKNAPLLVVKKDQDSFSMRGYIDRVDQAPDGSIRIIDYKTSAPYEFTASAVRQGKKLQLPLYALAARDALNLGDPADGFYWHVRDSKASSFTLAKFGPVTAIKSSVETAWKAIYAVRNGEFSPKPPRGGCPRYCPAANICWQYRAGFG
jgi:ATP-dependent helicase/DNAse subunit B